ncbi:MAG: hypothetical protein FJZ76_00165 [Bacteroidetes bacterium]|nr:hypothetical protein [Bacteroidota bacterium]
MLNTSEILGILKTKGIVFLKEGNGRVFSLKKISFTDAGVQEEGIYLLFDLFQIRSLCVPFSEVSLDIVDFASKPTIYQSPANSLLPQGASHEGMVRFSLIREPAWNKLLYQFSQPVLFHEVRGQQPDIQTGLYFPLFSPSVKELFLGPEGEVKIIKG